MKNQIIKLFSLITILIFVTGCGNKEVLSTNAFSVILAEKNFEILDLSAQYSDNKDIKNVIVAKSNKDYQVEFFVLSDEDKAQDVFNNTLNNINNKISRVTEQTTKKGKNYYKYIITAEGKFFMLYQVDNTFIYIESEDNNKEEINNLFKDVNY